MSSPLDRAIPTSTDYPDRYFYKCALCSKAVFTDLLKTAKEIQKEHTEETGHNVSFIRGKIIKPRKLEPKP